MKYTKKIKVIAPLALIFVMIFSCTVWLRNNKNTQFQISADGTPPAITTTNTCGMDISLVIDTSNSITVDQMTQMKTAVKGIVDAFAPNSANFSIVSFNTVAKIELAFTDDSAQVKSKIDSLAPVVGSNTNWQDALIKSSSTFDPRPTKGNLIILASDGVPNEYYDGAILKNSYDAALAAAVVVANTIKAGNTKILGLAIGSEANVDNFKQVTGPNVSPSPVPMGVTTDIITTDFSTMSTSLANLYSSMCSSTITIQTQIDTNNDGVADIDGGTANSLLSGFGFSLTGPTSSPALSTDQTGSHQYTALSDGAYSVTETPKNGYFLSSIKCTQNSALAGVVDIPNHKVSSLSITKGDNAYCIFLHNAQTPQIGLSVSVSPTGVPIGGGDITFSYTVNNPSSVPLSQVGITDKQCPAVAYVSGDVNSDKMLQNTETWQYTCSRSTTMALTSDALVTGYYNGVPVTALGSASVTIIPAGPPMTGGQK